MVHRFPLLITFSSLVWGNCQHFLPHYATISFVPDSESHRPKRNENNIYGFCPRFAIISLVPDSEGYDPKRNKNNNWGITQQHNKLLFNCPALSITVHKLLVRICLGLLGLFSRPHVIDWQVEGGGGGGG